MAAKTQTFTINASMEVSASVEISAVDWDDALQQARKLGVTDFVRPTYGDVFDDYGNFELTAIIK